jgi:hypothetical protein
MQVPELRELSVQAAQALLEAIEAFCELCHARNL